MKCYAVIDTNVLVSALLAVSDESATVQVEDTYLVTGNLKHFPKHTYIVTARQMLDILNEK